MNKTLLVILLFLYTSLATNAVPVERRSPDSAQVLSEASREVANVVRHSEDSATALLHDTRDRIHSQHSPGEEAVEMIDTTKVGYVIPKIPTLSQLYKYVGVKQTYKAMEWSDKGKYLTPIVIGGTFVVLGASVAIQAAMEHRSCEFVRRQQRAMQAAWDQAHPDGFNPVGGGMRPIDPICKGPIDGFAKVPLTYKLY